MPSDLLQFLVAGVTVGAIYALVGLGFSIIFNASQAINFAQGEFVMLGGMTAATLTETGVPLAVAMLAGIALTTLVGVGLKKLAIDPLRGSPVITVIMVTIGASIFLRGSAEQGWDRDVHSLPGLGGPEPIDLFGAAVAPQSLWVLGVTLLVVAGLWVFFHKTRLGLAMRASAFNPVAAQLVGIGLGRILTVSFALAAGLGALAGILIAPLSLTYADVGIMLGLKGFAASILGGLGNPLGAIVGGIMVGLAETLTAGYLSSAYKDAVAFLIILLVLHIRPAGLFGRIGGVSL